MRFYFILLFFINLTLFADPCSAAFLGAAHSGAPGEVNCAGCHSGSINSGPGEINYQLGVGNGHYTPNEVISIILSMAQVGVNQFGFQTVALRNSTNTNAGLFLLTDTDETRLIEDDHNGSDRIYVGHTICGADTDTLGGKQWSFQWQAPSQDIGNIQFYLSAIATNHNHATSGDDTYTQIITLTPQNIVFGDINEDGTLNILDIVLIINMILSNEYSLFADVNEDGLLNVLDAVLLIDMILNLELPDQCYIVPEVGPCDGICPTYYYNQSTNECEEFITGCCGVEVFSTLQECQNICE